MDNLIRAKLCIDSCTNTDGKYQIVNNGNQPVNCSFFYKGNGLVTLNGKPMQSKQVKNGMVCWGNIEVGDDNELVIK